MPRGLARNATATDLHSDRIRSLPPTSPNMIHPRTVLRTLAMTAAILAAACTDDSGPRLQPALLAPPCSRGRSRALPTTERPRAISRRFGGFFLMPRQADGLPHQSGRRGCEQALAPFLQARGLSPAQLVVRRGDFDYSRLETGSRRWPGGAGGAQVV